MSEETIQNLVTEALNQGRGIVLVSNDREDVLWIQPAPPIFLGAKDGIQKEN